MPTATQTGPLTLAARTARELMSPDLISVRENATVEEATAFFTDRGYSAAVVIDEAGHPIGVLSKSDILVHTREQALQPPMGAVVRPPAYVRDIMTPAVFSARLDSSAREVIDQMVSLRVHHLFVVDENNLPVGVVSSLDVMKMLK